MSIQHLLFKWRHLIASDKGPLSPTTRHVLLTLSLHMDTKGKSCFPSTKTLEVETGLSERSVITHLQIAVQIGWINKKLHGYTSQGWRRHQYEATVPSNIHAELDSAPSKIGTEFDSKDAETSGSKVLKEVQLSTSSNSTNNTTTFEEFWAVYPKKIKKVESLKLWKKMNLNKQVKPIVEDIKYRHKSDSHWLKGYIPDPTNYLSGERWNDERIEKTKNVDWDSLGRKYAKPGETMEQFKSRWNKEKIKREKKDSVDNVFINRDFIDKETGEVVRINSLKQLSHILQRH